jgi:ketosteroid isomerase-like protein
VPWFPEFVNALELVRRQTRAAGLADPATQYLRALSHGDAAVLETVWPGDVVVHDPRAGVIRGHRQLREFIRSNHAWFAARDTETETVASTSDGDRAVLELVAHLRGHEGQRVAWPVAVVCDSADDRSVVFRSYCSQVPVDGRHHLRPAILPPGNTPLPELVARYVDAQDAGDATAVARTFEPDGYYREPIGPDAEHRGEAGLLAFFTAQLPSGGVGVQQCEVTDDGVRCVSEYTVVRWGHHDLPPQAGLAVYERGDQGLLASVRVYDDVEPPERA